jgi:hypothetical protein
MRADNPLVVKADTGTARTVTARDFGSVITNRGGSATLTITLPAPASTPVGVWVEVFVVADQTVTINTTAGDQIVGPNDAAATSISFSTSGEKIGNGAWMVNDGTSWLAFIHLGDEANSVTVA